MARTRRNTTKGSFQVGISKFFLISLLVILSANAFGQDEASPKVARDKTPYKGQWASSVKKTKFFAYKRKEFSSPLAHEDRVFVGSNRGIFYAFQKKNGHKIWSFEASGPINSQPAVVDDKVLIGDDEGNLYALTVADGKLQWKMPIGSEIWTAPAVSGNQIFVATVEGRLVALDAGDGHILWEQQHKLAFTGNFKLTIRGNSPPVIDGDRLYIGFGDGTLYCLATGSGKILWEKSLSKGGRGFDDIDGAPLVDGERLYVATYDGGIYALKKAKGDVLWNQPGGSGEAMALANESLYVSGSDGRLYALNIQDGTKRWDTKIDEGALTAPVTYKDLVIVGLSESSMNFVRQDNGRVIARKYGKKGIFSDPVIDEDRIYFLSNGGRLYSLNLVR